MSEQRRYGQDFSTSPDFWQDDGDIQAPTVKPSNLVLPEKAAPVAYEITPAELSAIQQGGGVAGQVMRYEPSQHARSADTAITIARASLEYSSAYGCIFAIVALPVGLIAYFGFGLDGWSIALLGFLSWGAFTMYMLRGNREQGLHHSTTGIAHHEIGSRERIALHAIDKHVELLEKRWSIDR